MYVPCVTGAESICLRQVLMPTRYTRINGAATLAADNRCCVSPLAHVPLDGNLVAARLVPRRSKQRAGLCNI